MRYNILLSLLNATIMLSLYAHVSQEKDKITITVDDFRDNLEKPIIPFSSTLTARSLLGKSLQPLSITVHNGSDVPVSFSLASILNSSVHMQKVEQIKHDLYESWGQQLTVSGNVITSLCVFTVTYIEFLIALNTYRAHGRFLVTVYPAVLIGGMMSVLFTYLVRHQHRYALGYQKGVIDTILLSQDSHLIIKPGARAQVIALVDSKNYWGDCAVQLFDESGFQRVNRFDIDLNNQPSVVVQEAA